MGYCIFIYFFFNIYIETTDEYDQEFIRMKEEGQKSKLAKMTEDLEKAKNYVEECKRLLADKKRQVHLMIDPLNWNKKTR